MLLQQQVTAILYANPDWAPAHGGELRLWLPPDASDRCSSEGASGSNNAAPDQHNNGSPALHDHAAPDRLNNATMSAPELDDRDDHAAADGYRSESALTSIPDDHAAANTHDSGSALAPAYCDYVAAYCDYVARDSHSSDFALTPIPDDHAAADTHNSGSALAAVYCDYVVASHNGGSALASKPDGMPLQIALTLLHLMSMLLQADGTGCLHQCILHMSQCCHRTRQQHQQQRTYCRPTW